MRFLSAMALSQVLIMGANVKAIKNIRHVIGNWITPYPDFNHEREFVKELDGALDRSDFLTNQRIRDVEAQLRHNNACLEELSLRLCDVVNTIKEAKNEEHATRNSEDLG